MELTGLTGQRAVQRYSPSTLRPPRSRVPFTSDMFSATPTPIWWRAFSEWRVKRSSIRWVGTTTAYPRSAGYRTTTGSVVTRRFRTTPTLLHLKSLPTLLWRSAGGISSTCATSSPSRTRKCSRTCGGPWDCLVDWTQTYATIDHHSRRTSQKAFLRNLARGEAYSQEAPVLWDVDFKTAVAQAELEDRERPGAYHRVAFDKPDGSAIYIETTRPELICACVALVAHPDDERYQPLFGSSVTSPLYGVEVPVVAHKLADP